MDATTDTPNGLLRNRSAHMDNLQRLRTELPALNPKDAQRAENSMANLMQQVYDIDEQLRIKSQQSAQWSAA
ncbi:hypothetical protein ACQKFS_02420 [Pseudomonas guineae]|uniref:hypothetical protein n=1 Tax=Pseudomonas guineae TaxID=425504 RepID=UPI003D00BFE4